VAFSCKDAARATSAPYAEPGPCRHQAKEKHTEEAGLSLPN
jgi:hypothetical protein